jgi:hypothetical protein
LISKLRHAHSGATVGSDIIIVSLLRIVLLIDWRDAETVFPHPLREVRFHEIEEKVRDAFASPGYLFGLDVMRVNNSPEMP